MKPVDKGIADALDGVRGGAAFLVLLAHFNQTFNLPLVGIGNAWQIIPGIIASYSVVLFFMISGFWITISLLKNFEKNRKLDIKSYLIARVVRIYPPFIYSLIISVLVYLVVIHFNFLGAVSYRLPNDLYVVRERVDFNWLHYIRTFFMLHGIYPAWTHIKMNGPLWSISLEWWLYILALFYSSWILDKKILLGFLPLFLIISIEIFWGNKHFIFFSFVWGLGAIGAIIYLRSYYIKRFHLVLLLAVLVALLSIFLVCDWKIIIPYKGTREYIFQFFSSLFFLLLFMFETVQKFLGLVMFRFFSGFSYTLYVVHFPLLLLGLSFFHGSYSDGGWVERFAIFIFLILTIIIFSKVSAGYFENRKRWALLVSKIKPLLLYK